MGKIKSKRSRACEFSSDERKAIYERDFQRCVICGGTYRLTIAHMISRAYGGLGIRQNGVLLCMQCHDAMDNGSNKELRVAYQKFVRNYLEQQYPDFPDDRRIYRK